MHPLDSSLDASVHGHDNHNTKRKARRRTSLDNGDLDRPEMIMSVRYNSGSLGGSSYHTPDRPRRLSLNNTTALSAFFLAGSNYNVSTAGKSDLDLDCHTFGDEQTKNDSRHSIEYSSHTITHHSSRASLDVSKSNASKISDVVDDLDGDDDSDCDSFGEASVTAPPNQEYMMQDLGASCFWHDEDLIQMAEREISEETMQERRATAAVEMKYSSEPEECAIDPPDDTEMEDYIERSNHISSSEEEDEDCDSFCDATEKEPANKDYLKTDLGASCFWSSKEDLSLNDDELEDTLSNSIGTITEEN